MKSKELLTIFGFASMIFFAACEKDKFVEEIPVCPLVILTNPLEAATAVPLNQVITATFNEKMNPASLTAASYIITAGAAIPGTVTYSDSTVTFTPSTPLVAGTTYTGRVTTAAKDMKGNRLQEDYVWSFSTGALVIPMVIATDPLNNETGVALNKTITATFSVPMDSITLNAGTFTLKQGTNAVSGVVSYTGSTASFVPSANLIPGTLYTATITTGAKNPLGTPLAANYVWTFTTGILIAPTVISTDPINNATGVLLNKTITATFSVPMNPLTITNSTFTLKQGATNIAGVVTYTGTTASFNPNADLLPNVVYTATITTGATNLAGTPLANDYVWSFTSLNNIPPLVIMTDPVNNATGVPLNKTVTATFNMPMDPLTINSTTFTLYWGTTAIPGVVTYSGNVASFNPNSDLLSNVVYTATITTGAENTLGIPLVSNYIWSFTSFNVIPPTVISTDPINNAVGVALNKTLAATFSVAMDPLTITTSSFTLKQGTTNIPGVVTYSGVTAYYDPTATLLQNTVYTATITTIAENTLGTPIAADYVWSFTTGILIAPTVILTDPLNNATGVVLNKTLAATFSVPMDPLTITTATFTLHQGVTSIPGVVTYSGSTASFNPTNDLLPNVVYTATITSGAENLVGTPMASNYVWSFTTFNNAPPTVISTDPVNNATGVLLNKTVTATFSVPMDPLTISTANFTLMWGATSIPGVVTYSGTTASFNPNADLLPNVVYTATITTGATNTLGVPLASNYVWNFTTLNTIPPTVISTDPLNNATGVLLNKTVTATFSVPMDPLTITTSSFTLKQGLTNIVGVVSYAGSTASFNPTIDLLPNLVYTATITTIAENTLGIPMAINYVWSFTTQNTLPPTVISTDPLNNATGVLLNKTVTATFSVPMDPLTISTANFTLMWGATSIPGVVTYSGTTASFNPNADLLPNVVYTATITTGATNTLGVPLASNYVWNFTTLNTIPPTVISTDPLNNATGVLLNKTVTATFSVPMDPLTITTSSFTLKQGLTNIVGVVSYAGSTASFNPTIDLLPNLVYTATITTIAENTLGIPMASNYVWSFTTQNITAPTVISTDPMNNATGVLLNKTVTATFSMPMDPLTITTSTFTLEWGFTSIPGVVTYSGTTASFNPNSDLLPNVVYTATITTAAENTLGTPIASNYVWSFQTLSALPPTVISTDPLNNATAVPLNKVIAATFSVPMDPLTISTSSFTLKLGTTSIPGVVSYSGSTAYFTPNALLSSDAVYTATITTGAENLAGTPLQSNYIWTFSTAAHLGGPVVNLASAADFGILAGVGISNNAGFSVINDMNVGISPGVRSSITGFPPAIVVNGAIYASDDIAPPGVAAMLLAAKLDLTNAYLFAQAAVTPAPATVSGDQGGLTLAPGIYKSTSTLLIQNGDLTLDAQGDPNAVWIFQVAAAFTTIGGAGGNVILSGGAQAKNVFWQVGSSATIGDYTSFKGNVLALTSITMNSHATAVGRMLAINGSVVMTHTNIISKP
jgi:hypothetical protein